MAEESAAPEWAKDMIVTELRRAYPESVGKDDLQERCGIGPVDMRAALVELEEAGQVTDNDEGYRYVDAADGAFGPAPLSEDPDEGEDADEDVAAAEEQPAAPIPSPTPASEARYELTLVIQVSYYPEPEGDEGADAAALRESRLLADAAAEGILERYTDLPVAARIAKVEAYDNPRRVFPPES